MRLVILESPFAGDVERNVAYARACMADCLSRGEAPIASHLLYTQPGVLDDDKPDERKLGIDAGLAWSKVADAVVFYTDLGMSRGMHDALGDHMSMGRPIEYRTLPGWKWEPSEPKPEMRGAKPRYVVVDEAGWLDYDDANAAAQSLGGKPLPDDVRRLVIAARECSEEGYVAFSGDTELEEALEAFDGRVLGDPKTCETCFHVRAYTVAACPCCKGAERAPADNPTDGELLLREWGLTR